MNASGFIVPTHTCNPLFSRNAITTETQKLFERKLLSGHLVLWAVGISYQLPQSHSDKVQNKIKLIFKE